jgi:hypothetical protein
MRGWVSDAQYDGILEDFLADTPPDLLWPLSVHTYAGMRRDSTVSAVLSGYGLQIRRASWQLDGRACDPALTQLVSDDMDLPIVGSDTHGAARTRGVSWSDHLRWALSSLCFGHAGAELGADTSTGQARLVVLAERPQATITQIHADPRSGAFLGVTQDAARSDGKPQIPARQMAWYCHEREAAGWQGTSLLKSSWVPYLIKREMIRVNATSNRRWGAGVPVMEALPGTSPTPTQMQEAERLAAAARAGDQAGAATPPGFQLKIVGLSGAVPDTLGFLAWLDRQITRGALMPHLELGQGESGGARALGEAFIGSWTLALEAIGEQIASDATRQVAARIVAWNRGEDEPVPRVVVSGVGSRREVTAEALHLMLTSGALSADPGLEAWVRREYRLPEREGMAKPAPSVQGNTVAAAQKRKPRAKKQATGQLSFPIAAAARDLTADEQASGADFDQIRQQHDDATAALVATVLPLLVPIVAALVANVGSAVATGSLASLGSLSTPLADVDALAGAIDAAMVVLADDSARAATGELATIGVNAGPGVADEITLTGQAAATAQLIANSLANSATRTALLHAGPNADGVAVEAAVQAELDALTSIEPSTGGFIVQHLAAVLHAAQASGRMATFATVEGRVTLVAGERNDPSSCKPCLDVDGKHFETFAEAAAAYPAGHYVGCLGQSRCRGHLYALPA